MPKNYVGRKSRSTDITPITILHYLQSAQLVDMMDPMKCGKKDLQGTGDGVRQLFLHQDGKLRQQYQVVNRWAVLAWRIQKGPHRHMVQFPTHDQTIL